MNKELKVNINQSFSFLYIVLLFQIVRNISLIGYMSILLLAVLLVLGCSSINKIVFDCSVERFFFVMYSWLPIVTILNGYNVNEIVTSITRFAIMYMFLFLILLSRNKISKQLVRNLYVIYCRFISLSALTMIYQVFFGAIPFFATSAEREGLERFASLSGSLTVFGTAGAISICLILFKGGSLFSKSESYFHLVITTIGMLTSLQKSAVINIILISLLYVIKLLVYKQKKDLKFFVFVVILILVTWFFVSKLPIYEYVTATVKYSVMKDGDYSTSSDLLNRLTELPRNAYNNNDMKFVNLFFGKGLPMYAGTVGLVNYSMCHNNFFTMLYSGGLLYLLSFFILWIRKCNLKSFFSISVVILGLANMLIGAFEFFQPVIGVFVFVFVFLDKGDSDEN